MKGYKCKKCGTELEYEQFQGMRLKRINSRGEFVYLVYCPRCKKYYKVRHKG